MKYLIVFVDPVISPVTVEGEKLDVVGPDTPIVLVKDGDDMVFLARLESVAFVQAVRE